ncbi:MAG: beta-glucosidase BglX [Bryobacteraceae bacterium]
MRAHVLRLLSTACALSATAGIAITARTFSFQAPGLDGSTVDTKVNRLLAEMSPQEKIGQLSQLFYFGTNLDLPGSTKGGPSTEELVAKGSLGSLLFITDPAVINRFQHIAVDKSPHHIPLIFGFDVIHGFRTIFPVPIAMAAGWDPELARRAQTIAAAEARAAGIDWAFAPMLDIARDPRWGRIVEGAGEDPYLGSAMAAAQVRGFQGDHIGAPDHVLACAKHFAGYGAAVGGRDYEESYISEAQMWNVYLPPFHAAVDAGVGSVMSAYMDLNDVPATGNRWLLHDVLRQDWRFKGFVVSDANAVKTLKTHGFASSAEDSAVRAFTAGVAMEMAIGQTDFNEGLPVALQQGRITVPQLDDAVRSILEVKFRLGLFDHPYVDEARATQVLSDPEHRNESRLAAEKTMVLLRNEGGLLPLNKARYRNIAVVGPLADSQIDTLGPWSLHPDVSETVTLLTGLRNQLGPSAAISYAQGSQIRRVFPSMFDAMFPVKAQAEWSDTQTKQEFSKAVNLAATSDLVVMVLGEAQNMSGEFASRESLDLPGNQQQLLEAVAATGKPVVLVLLNGRPLNITWASTHVPAILEAWYPGTQGGSAAADVLLGNTVPSGKLPMTWPRNVGQVPIYYAHNTTQDPEDKGRRYWEEESAPLYPFGYGLSYAKFNYSNLHASKSVFNADEEVEIFADVTNTGSVAAETVSQLYVHQRAGSASRPVRELKGFRKVAIKPGATEAVRFTLGKQELTYFSAASHSWVLDPGTFDVWVGSDSTASLHGEIELKR